MNKPIVIVAAMLLAIGMASCGNSNEKVLEIIAERDSLRKMSETQSAELGNYVQMVEVFNSTLDSIAMQEGLIFVGTGETPVTKEDVRYNLTRFETILRKQEAKIRDLEARLASDNDSTNQALQLVSHLKKQIGIKNRQIAELKSELEKKNVTISELQQLTESQRVKIESQTVTINELSNRTRRQGEALARQDAMLNNGYVLIGSKSDLKRKGITKRGKLVANAVLDRTKFYQVDIRKWQEISFTAKRPRILTNMPASSYELTTTGDRNFTLRIINPADFWRISSYLVIQTD